MISLTDVVIFRVTFLVFRRRVSAGSHPAYRLARGQTSLASALPPPVAAGRR